MLFLRPNHGPVSSRIALSHDLCGQIDASNCIVWVYFDSQVSFPEIVADLRKLVQRSLKVLDDLLSDDVGIGKVG